MLSRHGYKVMMQWMGYDLASLKSSAQILEGIPVMGLDDLIDCKTRMGRKKDLEDIKRIQKLQKTTEVEPINLQHAPVLK